MIDIKTVKRFAWLPVELSNGDKVFLKFYHEVRKYNTIVDINKMKAHEKGAKGVKVGNVFTKGFKVINRY